MFFFYRRLGGRLLSFFIGSSANRRLIGCLGILLHKSLSLRLFFPVGLVVFLLIFFSILFSGFPVFLVNRRIIGRLMSENSIHNPKQFVPSPLRWPDNDSYPSSESYGRGL